jgi:hypothetical protein
LAARAFGLRYGPFERGERRATWTEIAAALGVDRKTLWRWRQGDDWRAMARDYRVMVREATRTDAAGMARAAVAHLFDLMGHARSEYVQVEAAKTLVEIGTAGEETDGRPGARRVATRARRRTSSNRSSRGGA